MVDPRKDIESLADDDALVEMLRSYLPQEISVSSSTIFFESGRRRGIAEATQTQRQAIWRWRCLAAASLLFAMVSGSIWIMNTDHDDTTRAAKHAESKTAQEYSPGGDFVNRQADQVDALASRNEYQASRVNQPSDIQDASLSSLALRHNLVSRSRWRFVSEDSSPSYPVSDQKNAMQLFDEFSNESMH